MALGSAEFFDQIGKQNVEVNPIHELVVCKKIATPSPPTILH